MLPEPSKSVTVQAQQGDFAAAAETSGMPTPYSGLLRTGLALKLSQIQLATRSYLRDRTNQATGTLTRYVFAVGLFGAASVFLIAACLVGAVALFRWIEVNYGVFPAFGAIGALLLVAAAICAALAVKSLKQPPSEFPRLASRLRVAIRANPVHSYQTQPALDPKSGNAGAVEARRIKSGLWSGPDAQKASTGWIVVAIMLGWAAARRLQQARIGAAPGR
jgi:hypothetical protein